MRHAFRRFQRYVANKTVGHDHVNSPAINIAAFNITQKVDGEPLEEIERLACEFVAFAFFFADGKQSHSRSFDAKHAAEVNVAHHRELFEIVRLAVDICSDVEQRANGTDRSWNDRHQSWPIDARQSAKYHLG